MKKLVLSALLATSVGGFVYAQAKGELKNAVDGGIARLAENGTNVTYGSAKLAGDGSVILNDVVIVSEDGEVQLNSSMVTSKPAGSDGLVELTFADTMTMTVTPDGDEELAYALNIVSEDLKVVGNFIQEETTSPEGSITANSLQFVGAQDDHPIIKNLDITQTGLDITFKADEEGGSFEVDGSMEELKGSYAYDAGEFGGSAESEFSAEDWEISFSGAGFDQIDDKEFGEFIADGGFLKASMTTGESKGTTSNRTPDFSMKMDGTSGAGSLTFDMNEDGVSYNATFEGADYLITPLDGSLPVPPFEVSMGEGFMDFAMPLMPTEDASEARVGFGFSEITVGESLWSLIDPEQTIPRDPANLRVEVDAALKLNAPIDKAAEAMDVNPLQAGELQSVNIREIYLNIGGASVEAEGGATMNNDGPFPMPNGEVDIVVDGVNGLSQKLVALGLLDQMQAGMAMGMMMAFAKPGEGADQFVSKIEFKDGGIFANGQPIQ